VDHFIRLLNELFKRMLTVLFDSVPGLPLNLFENTQYVGRAVDSFDVDLEVCHSVQVVSLHAGCVTPCRLCHSVQVVSLRAGCSR
jgi:hypothetical protein